MNAKKWQDMKQEIYDNATVLESDFETGEAGEDIAYIEFERDGKTYRFEYIQKPKIVDTKTVYSHRSGAVGSEQHVYGTDQKVHELKSYVLDETEDVWVEL